MAITYLSGKRIQGLSSDTKPTDVPVGSEFEQTNDYKSYQWGGFSDGIGSTGNGTVSGCTLSTSVKKLGTGSVFFDGVNDSITANGVATSSTIMAMGNVGTISCWFNSASMAVNGGKVLWAGGDTDNNAYLQADFVASGSQLDSVIVKYDGDYGWQVFTGTDTITGSDSFTTWHLYTLVHNGTTPIFYIDGVDISSGITWHDESDKTMWASDLTTIDNFKIGCRKFDGAVDNAFYKGYIDDFAIWNVALSATGAGSVASLWNSGSGALANTIPTGLKVYYDMNSIDDNVCANKAVGWVERGTAI